MSKLEKRALLPKLRFKDDKGKEYPGWESLSLDRIATITMGTSPPSVAYNQNQEGLPLIQGNADIKNRKSLPKLYTKVITKECLPNDTLLSIRAPVGEVACSDHHACIGRGIASIRARDSILRQNYLYNYMIWHEPKWKSLSQGSTFESVNSKDVRSLRVNIPSLKEQQKIADCLTSIDDLITAQTQKVDTLKTHKKGLMQQLFPQKEKTTPKLRFAEFSEKGGGGWKRISMGNIADIYQPKTISQSKLTTDGYPVYGSNGIIGFYSEFNHKNEQIAIACRGNCGLVNWTQKQSWITGNAMVINVDNNPSVFKKFLYYILDGSNLNYLITGSVQPQITGDIKNHVVLIPEKDEQQKIADCLTSIDDLITGQTQKIDALKTHKKGLMQQLFPSTDKEQTQEPAT